MNSGSTAALVLICALGGAPSTADNVAEVLARCRRAGESTGGQPQLTFERRRGAWEATGLYLTYAHTDPEAWDLVPLASLETLTAFGGDGAGRERPGLRSCGGCAA